MDYANDYAVSVDRMTNILWYKLGNGFGTKNYPCNVNIVLKARTVLSATIIAAITYIAIFFEKKLNSSIPLYICAAVDLFGLVLTAQVAIKKDIHKYLSKEDTAK